MIRITGLKKRLSAEFTLEIPALEIADGERVALIGPNGAGKSTLLRILGGQIKPDEGTVEIAVPGGKVGYQPQTPYVFKGTVLSNVRLGEKEPGAAEEAVRDCLLEDLKDKKTDRLSGGEKQRVCLARILAGNDRLLLLDEPLSAADVETGEALCEVLRARCERAGTTLIFSTHLPRQAALTATKYLILYNGALAEYGGAEVLTAPESAFGKRFLSQWKLD